MADEKTKKEPKKGVGSTAIALIKKGKTNDQVLAAIKEKFPQSKTSLTSINWYRNKLRQEGATLDGSTKPIPTSREQKAGPKKAAAAPKVATPKAADPLA